MKLYIVLFLLTCFLIMIAGCGDTPSGAYRARLISITPCHIEKPTGPHFFVEAMNHRVPRSKKYQDGHRYYYAVRFGTYWHDGIEVARFYGNGPFDDGDSRENADFLRDWLNDELCYFDARWDGDPR